MAAFDGKIVVVTGASRGIGLAIAQACGREGAKLVIVGRHRKALERAACLVPGGATGIVADVSRPADVNRLFRTLRRVHRRLDVLVNNAGVFTYKPFVRTTLEDWRGNLETNLTSLYLTVRAALPLFARSRAPHLVNILSISSRQAFPNCSAYTAAKFGALGFTRVLRQELQSRGIRVTAVLPGLTNTRMLEEFGFPIARARVVQPEDVAEAVVGALAQPRRTSMDEIVLTPSKGEV